MEESNQSTCKRKRNTSTANQFIQSLWEILEGNHSSIQWANNNTFTINNIRDFTEDVLPKYFKHSNFASFVRQLNMYGFRKCKLNGYENCFNHEYLNREKPNRLSKIQRKHSKKNEVSLLHTVAGRRELQMLQEFLLLKNKQLDMEIQQRVLVENMDQVTGQNKTLMTEVQRLKELLKRTQKVTFAMIQMLMKGKNTQQKYKLEKNLIKYLQQDNYQQGTPILFDSSNVDDEFQNINFKRSKQSQQLQLQDTQFQKEDNLTELKEENIYNIQKQSNQPFKIYSNAQTQNNGFNFNYQLNSLQTTDPFQIQKNQLQGQLLQIEDRQEPESLIEEQPKLQELFDGNVQQQQSNYDLSLFLDPIAEEEKQQNNEEIFMFDVESDNNSEIAIDIHDDQSSK